MYDLDFKKVLLIDFGLTYKTKSCYKYVSWIDYSCKIKRKYCF